MIWLFLLIFLFGLGFDMFNVDLMFIFFMFWSPSCFLVKVEFSSLFKELVNLLRRKPPYALFIEKIKLWIQSLFLQPYLLIKPICFCDFMCYCSMLLLSVSLVWHLWIMNDLLILKHKLRRSLVFIKRIMWMLCKWWLDLIS
jgi:hypothetical protein